MPYTAELVSSNPGANSFVVVSGDLPPGLTLNGFTGQIQGTPTQLGSFTFMGKMANNGSNVEYKTLTLTVEN